MYVYRKFKQFVQNSKLSLRYVSLSISFASEYLQRYYSRLSLNEFLFNIQVKTKFLK